VPRVRARTVAARRGRLGVFVFLACALGVLAASDAAAQTAAEMPGPLSHAHAKIVSAGAGPGCVQCHAPSGATEASRCLKCHQPIAQRMAAKKGVHREVTGDCGSCHVEHQGADAELKPLDQASFDHAGETGFPLTGGHARLAETCAACHKGSSYIQVTSQCSSCHRDGHRGALGLDCTSCHTPGAAFRNASRAFHKTGMFPLEGRHQAVPCASCHLDGVTKGTPTRCYDCHWVRRQDDRYRTALGADCETCHSPTAWTAVRWNHSTATGVALNVRHRTLACESCHAGQVFKGTQMRCETCHQADYLRAANPNHAAAGFPTSCDTCHLPSHSSWSQSTFNHRAVYTLVGVHATVACSSCHRGNVYKGTATDCVGCHQADYQRTAAPNHQAAGFPTTCNSCHRPTDPSFRGGTFNHGSTFQLVGVHASQDCASCHRNNVYKGTPRDCAGCHLADYQRAAAPNHQAAGFPTTCDTCHRPTDPSFKGGSMAHAFQLVGVHSTLACTACHKNNVYRGTPRDCVGCHLNRYQQTTSPNHASAGFPTTCDSCHRATDSSFRGASINHSQFYPLLGTHSTQQCTACHKNNVYRGTPRDCVACHLSRYQQTTNPNHQAAGFPTTCDSCHRASDPSFRGAVFNHTWFPITSGRHAGRACADCHTDSNNYKVFTCLRCHSLSSIQGEHQGNPGFRYESAACYSCHPTGRG